MGLIAGCSWTNWPLGSWTTKPLRLWNGWPTKLLNCLTPNHPSNYDCYSSKYLKCKWHRSNHLKFEFLSSQNFNSVHVKLIFQDIKFLNVIIPNIGILALILELLEYRSCPCKHWNYHVILQKIGILILSFQTLEFWPYPSKHWNTYFTHPNFGILALSFQTLKIHVQTFEFWPFPLKHSKTDLASPNFGILAYILPNIVLIILSFQTLELLLSYSCLTF